MRVVRRVKRVIQLIKEAWLVPRVPADAGICEHLAKAARGSGGVRSGGLETYLEDHPSIAKINVTEDWYWHRDSGEWRLDYHNSLFASGCLRVRTQSGASSTLIYFPGFEVGARHVLDDVSHKQFLGSFQKELNMNLACWDWPLQGKRGRECLYRGLGSVVSAEREYSRILPCLGTCLWREMIAELAFALEQIERLSGSGHPLRVVGWSMGGYFAYFAPLLGKGISSVTSSGSFARIQDLIARGETRKHGYFYYPLDGLKYFDLDDIVGRVLEREIGLAIIYGEDDRGCLDATRQEITTRYGDRKNLSIEILSNHGHVFSREMRSRIVDRLVDHSRAGRGLALSP